jgi:metal-dependent HD superfamily phosphatase/phosphodiesterase
MKEKLPLTLELVKNNAQVNIFLQETDAHLKRMGYTDHGLRHAQIVSARCRLIAQKIGLSEKEIEYASIAGYCHDIGNLIERNQHHIWGSLLFHQIFGEKVDDLNGLTKIMQAIVVHDHDYEGLDNAISAVLIIADKSDVHRNRVLVNDPQMIKNDIHDRVNYAVYDNSLTVDAENKRINFSIKLDTNFTQIMDYFAIFVERMQYCRKGAEFLGYRFNLSINEVDFS